MHAGLSRGDAPQQITRSDESVLARENRASLTAALQLSHNLHQLPTVAGRNLCAGSRHTSARNLCRGKVKHRECIHGIGCTGKIKSFERRSSIGLFRISVDHSGKECFLMSHALMHRSVGSARRETDVQAQAAAAIKRQVPEARQLADREV